MGTTTVTDHAEGWAVPGYVEQRELGHGAFGRVVEAVQERTTLRVAIRYLSPDLVADPDFLPRFRTQMLKLKELDVPSVVRVYDYAEQPGQGAAVVMELVDGVSLRAMIERQGPLEPVAALAVLKGSLLGLAAVHRLGFGHRDITPGNVLVDTSGQAKLTGFGMAAAAGEMQAVGTPLYLAPERWEGDSASPASDVYAATAVFFECLTGEPPFFGDLAALQEQHESGALPLDRVDPRLAPLIAQGMAKDPASRPHSANAFISELEALAGVTYGSDWQDRGRALLAGRAVAARIAARPLSRSRRQDHPGGSPAAAGGGRRRRLVIIASIAAAAVIVLAAIVTGFTMSGGGQKASLTGSAAAGTPGLPTYSAVANVTPPVAAATCTAPTAFTYSATISAAAPGTVNYQWVYSSGAAGPVRVVSFPTPGNHVVTGETVKVRRPGDGWAELKLLSPVPKTSAKATYRLLCGASRGGITATATVQPATRTASCVPAPPTFTADGAITAKKAETVSYYWAQSDGKNSAPATLVFARPGTMAARPLTIIPQRASGSGEAVLVVTSPVVAASGPATYTLSCTAAKTRTGPTGPITSAALSATASVSPSSQSLASCSAATPTFTFRGMITDSKAGTVGYHWQLPSGSGPAQTMSFSGPGTKPVTTSYTPGSDSASGSGTLVITSPGAVSSNPAAFTLSCGQGLGITNNAPTIAQEGVYYWGTVTVSGGAGPYAWSVTGLPAGLTANGGGATLTISGDPQAAGTFTPQISVSDSSSPQLTGNTSFALTVDGAAVSPLVISGYLPDAAVGQAYSATVIGTGGDGNYNWSVTGLPDGLTASASGGTLMVSGTPTDGGSFPVAVTVSDGESPAQTAAAVLTLVVDDPSSSPTSAASPSPSPSLSTDDGGSPDAIAGGSDGASGPSITITALPEGTVGDGYIAAATATGGDGTYMWSASGLPAGLRINARTGTISGAPTTSGNFQVDLKVSVGASPVRSGSVRLSLTINPGAPAPDPGSS
jgi:eukaryotic-like serine/threonine-protein kinase